MKFGLIFVGAVIFSEYCFASVSFSSKPTINVITDGGMDTIGSITTLAQGGREMANGDSFITIYYEEYTILGGKTWSRGARLYPSRNDTSSFGYSISLGQSLKTLDLLFSGTPTNNSVYVFQDTRTHWSEQQVLEVRDSKKYDMFGYSVQVDKYDPDRLIVGAPNDDDLGLSSGSAYIFNGSPNGKSWTLNQKLLSSDWHSDDLFGHQVTIAGNMAAVTSPGTCEVFLYSEDMAGVHRASLPAEEERVMASGWERSPLVGREWRSNVEPSTSTPPLLKWTEQQVLQYPGCGQVLSIAQYEERLVVGVSGDSSSSGAAYYLEAKTYVGTCDGDFIPRDIQQSIAKDVFSAQRYLRNSADIKLCTTTKWTEMQKLQFATGTSSCHLFGTDVDIYEDQLVVSSVNDAGCTGLGTVHPYQYSDGVLTSWKGWTVTSTLLQSGTDYSTDGYGGNELSIAGMDIAVSTKANQNKVYTYTGDASWNCIVVNLGDKFSDGWSGAELVITDEDGRQERYAPYCDSVINTNGFRVMRWCPDNELDRGDYTFEIVHAERFPFFWEIAWNIYQEYNQMTVYGDHKTKMTVHFDGSRVTVVSTENRLEQVTDNICESYTWCQVTPTPTQYPTRLPTPLPTPTESATVAPTAVVMPSPEAKTAMVAITYYDSGSNSWFKDYNQGTGYSITDRDGRKVYARGLMCQYQAELTCWYELPVDTKLVFRIAGGMDSDSNQHHWSFCNKIGTAGQDQQLDFYLSDGLCIAESLYSSTLYCRDKLHIAVASAGIVLLHGLADLSELSSSDEMALTWAISAIMGSQENLYVTYQYSRDLTFDALKVEFNVEVPTYLVGYDGSDPDNLVPAYRAVTEKLGDGFNSGRFVSYIEQFAVLHSGEALDIVNHGFVELEALQEGVLRDHTRWTNAPSPFYEDIPTSAPSKFSTPTPTQPGDMTSSKAGKPSSGHHHPSSTEETDWSSAVTISAAVVGVGLFLMFLLRNQNQSTADVVSDVQTRGGRKSAYRELSTDSYHGQGDRLVAGQDDDEEEGGAGPEVIKEILLAAAAETSKETRPLRLSRARKDESSNSSSSEGSDDDVDQEVRTGTARTKSSSTNSGKYSRSHTSSRKYRPPSNSKLRTSKR